MKPFFNRKSRFFSRKLTRILLRSHPRVSLQWGKVIWGDQAGQLA